MTPNSNGNSAPSGAPNAPQSWFDLIVMQPMDPRSIISTVSFENNASSQTVATFARSSTWLESATWINPPLIVSQTASYVICPNAQDFASVEEANVWNGLHQMTALNNQLPIAVQKIMFLKAGTAFVNNIFLDWSAGVTSTNVQLSFRDNSTTSGMFQNSGTATVPIFLFTGATFGLTARNLQVTLLRTGRFHVALRILDNSGNYSLYEMEWIVLP
jgi:hypothetical protein